MREKDLKRFHKSLAGIKDMKELPGCLFIIDPANEMTAIAEARKIGIPIVAVCDTNSDPDLIDFPIPGNDDAIRAIRLITSLVADAVHQGRELKNQNEAMQMAEAEEGIEQQEGTALKPEESETLSSPS